MGPSSTLPQAIISICAVEVPPLELGCPLLQVNYCGFADRWSQCLAQFANNLTLGQGQHPAPLSVQLRGPEAGASFAGWITASPAKPSGASWQGGVMGPGLVPDYWWARQGPHSCWLCRPYKGWEQGMASSCQLLRVSPRPEGRLQKAVCQHQCPHGRMSSQKLFCQSLYPQRDPCLLPLQEVIQDQQVSLTQAAF